jgi:hypothetical protein
MNLNEIGCVDMKLVIVGLDVLRVNRREVMFVIFNLWGS